MGCCPKCGGTGKVRDEAKHGKQFMDKRIDTGQTLREVSAAMGISISYLSDLEHGRKRWTETMETKFFKAMEWLASNR